MKKLALLLPLLLLTTPALAEDTKKASQAAPVTSYVPVVGQKLVFSTAQIISGTRVQVKESVLLKAITPKKKITVQVTATLKKQVLAQQEFVWDGFPDHVFADIFAQLKPELKTTVIANKSFTYIEIKARGETYWFVTDGKKHIFPGVIRITRVKDGNIDTLLELVEIKAPKPKKK